MDVIIVADDSKIVQNVIEKALVDEDVIILKANNGYEAVNIVKDNSYNISGILLDLSMPKYDGFVVLKYFEENNLFDKIPVSIISGDDTKETINKVFKYPIVDMLNKPFTKENIKSIVYKMINNKA